LASQGDTVLLRSGIQLPLIFRWWDRNFSAFDPIVSNRSGIGVRVRSLPGQAQAIAVGIINPPVCAAVGN
jgi:hypothetical protein